MKKVSRKDIRTFGRVLEVMGQYIQEHPDFLEVTLSMLSSSELHTEVESEAISLKEIESFNLFSLAKNISADQLVEKLNTFNVAELREILRNNHLGGGSKFRSHKALVQFISEQAIKRTTDVFRDHNKSAEGERYSDNTRVMPKPEDSPDVPGKS